MEELIEEVAKAMWEVRRKHAQQSGITLEEWGDGTLPKANGIYEEAAAAINTVAENDPTR